MDDYLEKLFADAYGREVEQEEKIAGPAKPARQGAASVHPTPEIDEGTT
jgi:hypothetical protein